ncbi:MAG: response regulator transcription factor [Verrucomicrobia bacterium]|nr:response regulator transcription factor [Verrucomicrobiota bacterium]
MKMMFNHGNSEFKCVGAYQDPQLALQEIIKSPPDVVLMDIRMDGPSTGIECTRRLKTALPNLRVIMVTAYTERMDILKSFMAGATGYILKPANAEEYRQSVRQVARGGVALSAPIQAEVIHSFHSSNGESGNGLSAREHEVLILLLQNKSDKEIAQVLNISQSTVHAHSSKVFAKLGAHSRAEAVAKFLRL